MYTNSCSLEEVSTIEGKESNPHREVRVMYQICVVSSMYVHRSAIRVNELLFWARLEFSCEAGRVLLNTLELKKGPILVFAQEINPGILDSQNPLSFFS